MELEESLDSAFGQEWVLGEGKAASVITGRYFFKNKKHVLRCGDDELDKDTVLTNPKGKVFIVVDSYQVASERFEHVLQVKAKSKASRTQWRVNNV